jgi:hypothetical protein
MSKVNKSEIIRKLHKEGKTVKEIKAKTKYSDALVRIVIGNYKKKLKKSKIIKAVKETKQAMDVIQKPKVTRKELLKELLPGIDACFGLEKKTAPPAVDPVNHPPHYKTGGVETIDFIEAKDLNYRLGNVVKYVSRAGKKGDPIQDLEKAAWYLQREITARKNA